MIPNGGNTKVPTNTAKVAPLSPSLLPPNLFTDIELANKSATSKISVKMTMETQKKVDNRVESMKK